MPPAHLAVYQLLTDEWQSSRTLRARFPLVRGTAFANRLAWLREEGFADSRPTAAHGRILEWRRT